MKKGLWFLLCFCMSIVIFGQNDIAVKSGNEIVQFHDMGDKGAFLVLSPMTSTKTPKDGEWEFIRINSDMSIKWNKKVKIVINKSEGESILDGLSIFSTNDGKNIYFFVSSGRQIHVHHFDDEGNNKYKNLIGDIAAGKIVFLDAKLAKKGLVIAAREFSNYSKHFIVRYDLNLNLVKKQEFSLPAPNAIAAANEYGLSWMFLGAEGDDLIFYKTKEKRKQLFSKFARISEKGEVMIKEFTSEFNGASYDVLNYKNGNIYHIKYDDKNVWCLAISNEGKRVFYKQFEDKNISKMTKKYSSPWGHLSFTAKENVALTIRHSKNSQAYSIVLDNETGDVLKSDFVDLPKGLNKMGNGNALIAAKIVEGDLGLKQKCSNYVKNGENNLVLFSLNSTGILLKKKVGDQNIDLIVK